MSKSDVYKYKSWKKGDVSIYELMYEVTVIGQRSCIMLLMTSGHLVIKMAYFV